jgi:hypothetical protein
MDNLKRHNVWRILTAGTLAFWALVIWLILR